MILSVLNSNQYNSLFGSPSNPTPKADIVMIGQKPDCSAFLLLSTTTYPELHVVTTVPDGFDFTYRQCWGLIITDAIVARVIRNLRAEAYPPMADYLDAIVQQDQPALQRYIAACLAVKAKYPK